MGEATGEASPVTCSCGYSDCMSFAMGYPWCRPCEDHHRIPECAINEDGEPLASCGCTWELLENNNQPCPHYEEAC